jgi:hypothetical protein
MKKFMVFLCLAFIAGYSNGQTIVVSLGDEIIEGPINYFCADTLIIHGDSTCQLVWYFRPDGSVEIHSYELVVTENENQGEWIFENPCESSFFGFGVYISSPTSNAFNPFDEPFVWKRFGDTITLGNPEMTYVNFQWSTGESSTTIDVVNDGVYYVEVNDPCGPRTYSIQVRNNVEIYRAGVDPATNKNKVRWNTTPQQATYVSSVKIERDGMVVGTVPYLDGEFLDAIGSENAARIYKITAIDTDGNECPLPSYQFGTFNTIISPDIANPSLMNFTWEDPFIEEGSPYSVVAYRIGRFNEATGEFIMIDQLSANVHIGKYNMDLFDGDYGIVAAVFNDAKNRDYEELAFSNRSDNEIVGIGETQAESFEVYPNPSNGVFTVKGTGTLRISNVLGQEIMAMEIDGKETVELPTGVYFVQLNGTVRKIVVE